MLRYPLIKVVFRRAFSASRPCKRSGRRPGKWLVSVPWALRSSPDPLKHPAVVFAVHAAFVSERIVTQ